MHRRSQAALKKQSLFFIAVDVFLTPSFHELTALKK